MSDAEQGARPLTEAEIAEARAWVIGDGGLGSYWTGRLLATLDAERAANAELRRALEEAAAQSAQYRLLLVETLQQCSEFLPWVLREELRSALLAAEKATETTEPVRMMLVTHASVKTGAMVAHLRDQAADMMWRAFGAVSRRATPEEALEALATWLDARAELKAAEKAGGR